MLSDDDVRATSLRGKGVGSQGDGSVQFVCDGEAGGEACAETLRRKFGVRPLRVVIRARAPSTGDGTSRVCTVSHDYPTMIETSLRTQHLSRARERAMRRSAFVRDRRLSSSRARFRVGFRLYHSSTSLQSSPSPFLRSTTLRALFRFTAVRWPPRARAVGDFSARRRPGPSPSSPDRVLRRAARKSQIVRDTAPPRRRSTASPRS